MHAGARSCPWSRSAPAHQKNARGWPHWARPKLTSPKSPWATALARIRPWPGFGPGQDSALEEIWRVGGRSGEAGLLRPRPVGARTCGCPWSCGFLAPSTSPALKSYIETIRNTNLHRLNKHIRLASCRRPSPWDITSAKCPQLWQQLCKTNLQKIINTF